MSDWSEGFANPRLPTLDDVKAALGIARQMTEAPKPVEDVDQAIGQYRGGDYLGALESMYGAVPATGAIKSANYRINDDDLLMALHNIRSNRTDMIERLGGLPAPSIAITKPSQGFSSFGDISLIGGPEHYTPRRNNPVFASDVYSPRFPSLNDEGDKIFRGFTDLGNRRYSPLNMKNVLREMKGNIRGGEGSSYGAGSVRSAVTPQFSNVREMQANRDKVVSDDQFSKLKDETNKKLIELADEFYPYSKYSGNHFEHSMSTFPYTLQDVARRGTRAFAQDYNEIPLEIQNKAMDYLSYLRDMPTQYFEAKPQRAVGINEFRGAVVPHDVDQSSIDVLRRLGIPKIEEYEANNQSSRIDAFRKFRDMMFSFGGAVDPIDDALRIASETPS